MALCDSNTLVFTGVIRTAIKITPGPGPGRERRAGICLIMINLPVTPDIMTGISSLQPDLSQPSCNNRCKQKHNTNTHLSYRLNWTLKKVKEE